MTENQQPEPGVVWLSVDPRTHAEVPYTPKDNAEIERAFLAQQGQVEVILGGSKFTIDFGKMRQMNASGGSRAVMRRAPLPRFDPKYALLPMSCIQEALEEVRRFDECVKEIEAHEWDTTYTCSFDNVHKPVIISIMDKITNLFKCERYRGRYGFTPDDEFTLHLALGQRVPNYYANVSEQSIFQRKMLSLAGLRNLIQKGPEIFFEMQRTFFSGNIADYADKTGPHKMRYYTGNTVDLDSTVLRPSEKAVFDTINMLRAGNGQRPFANPQELAHSADGLNIAKAAAKPLVDVFVDRMKLSPVQIHSRCIDLDAMTELHVAQGNTDRGTFPLWLYENVGVLSFHVNVPTLPDIYGALLRAPYHLVKGFALLQLRCGGDEQRLCEALDDFFERAVADSCFNAKWKSIEEYAAGMENVGSISNVLNDLQMKHQDVFTPQFMEADPKRERETREMWRLAQESSLTGRGPQGNVRKITLQDVIDWIRATS